MAGPAVIVEGHLVVGSRCARAGEERESRQNQQTMRHRASPAVARAYAPLEANARAASEFRQPLLELDTLQYGVRLRICEERMHYVDTVVHERRRRLLDR